MPKKCPPGSAHDHNFWERKPKHVKRMVQHGSKFGPTWGHVGFQNRPGRVQGRKKRIPEAIRKEDQKKYRKTSVLGGSQTGSAGVGGW